MLLETGRPPGSRERQSTRVFPRHVRSTCEAAAPCRSGDHRAQAAGPVQAATSRRAHLHCSTWWPSRARDRWRSTPLSCWPFASAGRWTAIGGVAHLSSAEREPQALTWSRRSLRGSSLTSDHVVEICCAPGSHPSAAVLGFKPVADEVDVGVVVLQQERDDVPLAIAVEERLVRQCVTSELRCERDPGLRTKAGPDRSAARSDRLLISRRQHRY